MPLPTKLSVRGLFAPLSYVLHADFLVVVDDVHQYWLHLRSTNLAAPDRIDAPSLVARNENVIEMMFNA